MKNLITAALTSQNNHNDNKFQDQEQFCYESTLNMDDLSLAIKGIGDLLFPLSKQTITELINIAQKAKYGLKEETLLDKEVRDTYEISPENIIIKYQETNLQKLLENIRVNLGLPENNQLQADLHNLLIYDEGHFFKAHQDTEKTPNMVATLVVVLPSMHIGGNLLINHDKDKYNFSSEHIETDELKIIAFYSDCIHEIKKVRAGKRIVLTFNLSLAHSIKDETKYDNPALEDALRQYFTTTIDNNHSKQGPKKLVYFLDHSYTEHSLRWYLLKNNDRRNALSFLNAAKKLDLVIHLGLIEIMETWTAYDECAQELIDDSTSINYWIDTQNKKVTYSESVLHDGEIFFSKDTSKFEPVDTEYEGYMGNYGETMDYWYRRGAVILWRRCDALVMEFTLDYASALNNLYELTQHPANENKVIDIVNNVKDKLFVQQATNKYKYWAKLVNIAIYINNPKIANFLSGQFYLNNITREDVEWLVNLQKRYGTDWCIKIMQSWQATSYQSQQIIQNFSDIIRNLHTLQSNIKILQFLLKYQLENIIKKDKTVNLKFTRDIKNETPKRFTIIEDLIYAINLVKDQEVLEKLTHHLIANSTLYPILDLAQMLLRVRDNIKDIFTDYSLLKKRLYVCIANELKEGARDANDYSIKDKLACNCDACKYLEAFLASPTESQIIWATAKKNREHIQNVLQRSTIEVTSTVKNVGSPHKLIITKNSDLYIKDKRRFQELKKCYYALETDC